jgi:ribosomal protein RSM22 (predicted rRNA methylase)
LNVSLPQALVAVIDALVEGVSRDGLAAHSARLSAAYRGGGTSAQVTGEADALAYAIARMPATYAAVCAVLARVREVMPDFAPRSLADIGAGPGTASWAALQAWPAIAGIVMLDRNPSFRDMAAKLAAAGPAALAQAQILSGDLAAPMPEAELVMASYVLAELPPDRIAAAVIHLWQSASQMLVLVEPGTPQGFARIRAAREALLAAGAHVAAPCTHDNACPMPQSGGESRSDKNSDSGGERRSDKENKANNWCHFSQRLPRSRDHMRLKNARVPFEDERYCYLAVTRTLAACGARIVAPPRQAKPGITFSLCDGAGLRDELMPRRDKPGFARARRLGWGDLF